ncbi:hypothetical protein [Actinacidiphila sp. bgisy167]|uniref:hypothetical protein n=1 Tax=Actinacidiphila sp. bgisy167 TaxID=3413797 RepID=UPI003D72A450
MTAEQQGAVDAGSAAGLRIGTSGWFRLRGTRPPEPYIPSGFILQTRQGPGRR